MSPPGKKILQQLCNNSSATVATNIVCLVQACVTTLKLLVCRVFCCAVSCCAAGGTAVTVSVVSAIARSIAISVSCSAPLPSKHQTIPKP